VGFVSALMFGANPRHIRMHKPATIEFTDESPGLIIEFLLAHEDSCKDARAKYAG
jgi:hypothetical protein